MPSFRPSYKICPGDRLEVEVVQPDGGLGRALVVGKLDAVPEAAGGRALRIVVCDARITALPVQWGAEPVLARVSNDHGLVALIMTVGFPGGRA